MKRTFISVVIAASIVTSIATPAAASDVAMSISIGQPGFYGQIDIGDYPQPRTIYRNPVIIDRSYYNGESPIYLNVPPGHAKNWRKNCGRYNACGRRVYFVNNDWYNQQYVPRYQARHGDGRGSEHGNDRGNGQDGRGNDHGKDRGNEHNGNGSGRGH